MRGGRRFSLSGWAVALLATAGPARATPPPDPAAPTSLTPRLSQAARPVSGVLPVLDPAAQFDKVAAFEAKMQEAADGADQGGVHEVEMEGDAKAFAIIQSDNTQEAIWTWSRWRQAHAGDAKYDGNVTLAWKYLDGHPGWMEEGGDPPASSYRVYNCSWGVRAALEYRAATGLSDHDAYGATCAAYLRDHPLKATNTQYAGVLGWAATALYAWALDQKDDGMRSAALAMASADKDWLDADLTRVRSASWAITGGGAVYAVLAVLFTEDPPGVTDWVKTIGPELGGFVDDGSKSPDWHEWWNAWSAWNMLAVHEAARIDPSLAPGADLILGKLVDQDTDDDGGMPGSVRRPATEDQSWITNYLGWMGLAPRVGGAAGDDAGTDGGGDGSGGGGGGSGGCTCNIAGVSRASTLPFIGVTAGWLLRRRRRRSS